MDFEKFPFFHSFTADELQHLRQQLIVHVKEYKKDAYLFTQGDKLHDLYFLSHGRLAIYHENLHGDSGLISYVEEGECFAESYAILHLPLRISITALQDSQVFHFQLPVDVPLSKAMQKVLLQCNQMLAIKNTMMNERMQFLTHKKMRDRLLTYLYELSLKHSSLTFPLPYTRQAMADYLCIDRSAMSRELYKMEKDGFLIIHKQIITLLKNES